MSVKKEITIEKIYKMMVELQRDITFIKKGFLEEPSLRDEFLIRMRNIEHEESVLVNDFGKRYGLK